MSADPWFQIAVRRPHRRGQLRQGHRDLQVREDQARQAEGPRRPPRAQAARLRHRRERRHGRRSRARRAEARGRTRSRTAATPTTASPHYKDAAAEFMKRQFGVDARPGDGGLSLHRLASRPTRCCRPCFINPGDVTLMTVPGYPVAGTHTQYLGGEVHHLPLLERERLLPRPRRHPGRRQEAGEAAGHQLPEQPDRGGRDDATSTSGSSTSPTRTRSSIVQDAAHILLSYDGRAAELPAGRRGEGGRRRGPLDVEGLQHDRLAARASCAATRRSCRPTPT